jgi:hypothetical protein
MRTALAIVAVLMVACGRRHVAEQEVARIGPSRLIEAAESVRTVGERSAVNAQLPEAAWPDAIRLLKPQAVFVGRQGVFVRLKSSFTTESGVLVAFAGISIPTERGQDPAFARLADRIYWYEIKG